MTILGISAFYHDSAAALCVDGKIVAASSEERFTRKKADASLPVNAIKYCLSFLKGNIDAVVYYDNPFLSIDRWYKNAMAVGDKWEDVIAKSYDAFFVNRINVRNLLKTVVGDFDKFLISQHHYSHAASAFYPSPFSEAAILTVDGVGEWATTTIGIGKNNKIQLLQEIDFPHSLGLLYSAFTYFCGFKVNFGEYKLMGLAPYGKPKYKDLILKELINVRDDGSYQLNMDYFTFLDSPYMVGEKFEKLFGVKPRQPESEIEEVYMDIAASIQEVTEEIILKLAIHAKDITGAKNLVMAGGVALNCSANGKLLEKKIFDNIWIQPAAGDAGGALGAALYATYEYFDIARVVNPFDSQQGSFLGPAFSEDIIQKYLDDKKFPYAKFEQQELFSKIADYLEQDKVIGVFQGRMEFGPRALGGRSIIANAKSADTQKKVNLKIKYRESFRPFAPAVLKERCSEYFDLTCDSPYMLLVVPVATDKRIKSNGKGQTIYDKVNEVRSEIPAVTHVDYSARVQTVDEQRNPYFYKLIKEYEKKSGCPVIVNTSFNVRGEPIVCTPEDAYRCFMRTEMDVLVLENCVLEKEKQPEFKEDDDWRSKYELD